MKFQFEWQLYLKHSLVLTPVSERYLFFLYLEASWQKKNIMIKIIYFLKQNRTPLVLINSGFYVREQVINYSTLFYTVLISRGVLTPGTTHLSHGLVLGLWQRQLWTCVVSPTDRTQKDNGLSEKQEIMHHLIHSCFGFRAFVLLRQMNWTQVLTGSKNVDLWIFCHWFQW